MSRITYSEENFASGEVRVYSGGLRVGTIKPVTDGFRYFPKGITNPARAGEVCQSIAAVKRTLQ